ncbi:AAA family ATPase [Lysobacter soli]|uniref:AAA family ATPase n=1 Tax=Lysobacter soli TaxID=453783 RepID=UPI00240EAD2B|nr:helicase RepA family protein [Lysobacter soli]MDG2516392.1 helicase RepA family protein [Lysobacter soli]
MIDYDNRTPDELAERFANVVGFDRMRSVTTQEEPLPRAGLTFRPLSELEMREPEWLVRDLMEVGSLAVMVGEPGIGKSFCALSLAACVATGTPWHGRAVRRGPVLYIAGEGQAGIWRRCMAWDLHHRANLFGAPLLISTAPTGLTDGDSQHVLRAEVERACTEYGPPALIVIDTLARNFGPADENNTRDMNAAVAACDALRTATGAAVLVVHHSGHADKNRGRGSIALRAAADSEFVMKPMSGGGITLTCTKIKDAPMPEPVAFSFEGVDLGVLDGNGEIVTSAILIPTSPGSHTTSCSRVTGKNQILALEILRSLYAQIEAGSPAASSEEGGISLTEWRRLCEDGGIDRRRFPEVRRGLEANGSIRVDGTTVLLLAASEHCPKRTPSDTSLDIRTVRTPFRGSDVRTSDSTSADGHS